MPLSTSEVAYAQGANGQTKQLLPGALRPHGNDTDIAALLAKYSESNNFASKNSAWIRQGVIIKQSYSDALVKKYKGAVFTNESLDKGTSAKYCKWLFDNTHSLISNLSHQFTEYDRVLLSNASCFMGTWDLSYNESMFTVASGGVQNAEMLERTNTMLTARNGSAYVYKKGYTGGEHSFLDVLPTEKTFCSRIT